MKNQEIYQGPVAQNCTVDLLVVGSGTGMAAALAAHEKGLTALVIEKTNLVGGSTARSGGAFWIPANPILQKAGADDTLQKAEVYLDAIVSENAPKSRWNNFLKHGSATVEMLERTTPMKFFWAKGYADYHPENPGGAALGRTCECVPFNLSQLGKDLKRFRPGVLDAPIPMPVTGYDYKWMALMTRLPFKAFPLIFKRMFQGVGGLLIGRKYAAGGQALAAGMFAGLLKANVPVWTNAKLVELIIEDEKVTGAVIEQNQKTVRVHVNKGVVLAAGGFDHNMPMRQKYQSASLTENLSLGAEGNEGDGILAGEKADAEIKLMDQTWWFPAAAPLKKGEFPQVLLAERSLPGGFMVNQNGQRFINEATDYMSFGQQLLKMEKEGKSIKEMWLIIDQRYKNRYLFAGTIFPMMPIPKEWFDAGIAFTADTPEALAKAMHVPQSAFAETFNHFNQMARAGKDTDFGRGNSAYDRYYGDPTVKPNPNLRALEGKLYAIKIVLSDLGTCGGLVTDENGRVMTADNNPIEGLYALGNNASNAFGKVYPGAGGTIGQGLVFGYIIAEHAASNHAEIRKEDYALV
jgi:3-oxosteroid 1-dehydrogenase